MKRHEALIGLSQEHHHGLVLARRCISGDVGWDQVARIFAAELEPHFRIEEERLLPALGEDHRVDRTFADHASLREKLAERGSLVEFGEHLRDHIRFEERELFAYAQEVMTPKQLDDMVTAWPRSEERVRGALDFVVDFHADLSAWFAGTGDREAIWSRFEAACPGDMSLVYPSGVRLQSAHFLESIRERFGSSPGFEAKVVDPELVVAGADHAVVAYTEVQAGARSSAANNTRSALAVLVYRGKSWRWRFIQETAHRS